MLNVKQKCRLCCMHCVFLNSFWENLHIFTKIFDDVVVRFLILRI